MRKRYLLLMPWDREEWYRTVDEALQRVSSLATEDSYDVDDVDYCRRFELYRLEKLDVAFEMDNK